MPIKKQGWFLIVAIVVLFVVSTGLTLLTPWNDPSKLLIRLFALYGYLALALTTMLTPFLIGVAQSLGKPFLRIHHIFSIFGIVFTTLHPSLLAIQTLNITIFIPRFDSWRIFWVLAGRPAFVILYIALISALLRRKVPKHWRFFHVLMYVVLFFGIVHANFIGTDFQNFGIRVIFNLLFFGTLIAFIIKRYRNYAMRNRARSAHAAASTKRAQLIEKEKKGEDVDL